MPVFMSENLNGSAVYSLWVGPKLFAPLSLPQCFALLKWGTRKSLWSERMAFFRSWTYGFIVLTMGCDYICASFGHPHPSESHRPPLQITFCLSPFLFLKPHYSGWRVLLWKRWLEFGLAFMCIAKDVGSAFGGFPSVQSIQAAENHNKWSSESMQRRDIMV